MTALPARCGPTVTGGLDPNPAQDSRAGRLALRSLFNSRLPQRRQQTFGCPQICCIQAFHERLEYRR
jgi:hypothetical protein